MSSAPAQRALPQDSHVFPTNQLINETAKLADQSQSGLGAEVSSTFPSSSHDQEPTSSRLTSSEGLFDSSRTVPGPITATGSKGVPDVIPPTSAFETTGSSAQEVAAPSLADGTASFTGVTLSGEGVGGIAASQPISNIADDRAFARPGSFRQDSTITPGKELPGGWGPTSTKPAIPDTTIYQDISSALSSVGQAAYNAVPASLTQNLHGNPALSSQTTIPSDRPIQTTTNTIPHQAQAQAQVPDVAALAVDLQTQAQAVLHSASTTAQSALSSGIHAVQNLLHIAQPHVENAAVASKQLARDATVSAQQGLSSAAVTAQQGFNSVSASVGQGVQTGSAVAQETASNVANSTQRNAQYVQDRTVENAQYVQDRTGDYAVSAQQTASNAASSLQQTASNMAGSLQQTASNLSTSAQENVQYAQDRASNAYQQAPSASQIIPTGVDKTNGRSLATTEIPGVAKVEETVGELVQGIKGLIFGDVVSSSTAVAPLDSTSTSHQSAVIPKDGERNAPYSAANPSGTVPSSSVASTRDIYRNEISPEEAIAQTGSLEGAGGLAAGIADEVASAAQTSSATSIGSSSPQGGLASIGSEIASAAQSSSATGHPVFVPGEEPRTQGAFADVGGLAGTIAVEVASAAKSSSATGHPVYVPGEEPKLDAYRSTGTREEEHAHHSHHHHGHHHGQHHERDQVQVQSSQTPFDYQTTQYTQLETTLSQGQQQASFQSYDSGAVDLGLGKPLGDLGSEQFATEIIQEPASESYTYTSTATDSEAPVSQYESRELNSGTARTQTESISSRSQGEYESGTQSQSQSSTADVAPTSAFTAPPESRHAQAELGQSSKAAYNQSDSPRGSVDQSSSPSPTTGSHSKKLSLGDKLKHFISKDK